MVESISKTQNIMGRALRIAIVIAALVAMAGGAQATSFTIVETSCSASWILDSLCNPQTSLDNAGDTVKIDFTTNPESTIESGMSETTLKAGLRLSYSNYGYAVFPPSAYFDYYELYMKNTWVSGYTRLYYGNPDELFSQGKLISILQVTNGQFYIKFRLKNNPTYKLPSGIELRLKVTDAGGSNEASVIVGDFSSGSTYPGDSTASGAELSISNQPSTAPVNIESSFDVSVHPTTDSSSFTGVNLTIENGVFTRYTSSDFTTSYNVNAAGSNNIELYDSTGTSQNGYSRATVYFKATNPQANVIIKGRSWTKDADDRTYYKSGSWNELIDRDPKIESPEFPNWGYLADNSLGTAYPTKQLATIPVVNPDFTISTSPSSQTVTQGSSTFYQISLSPQNSFNMPVTMSASGLPSTYSFSTNSATPPAITTINVQTLASTSPGTYTITIIGSGGGKTHSSQVTLVVRGGASLSGSVVDGFCNEPVNLASVTLSGATPTGTDNTGGYQFSNVGIGTYTISVSKGGYDTAQRTKTLSLGQNTQDFRLNKTAGYINGYMKDASGNPVSGATVTITGPVTSTWSDVIFSALTNINGYFSSQGLHPGCTYGAYTVKAMKSGNDVTLAGVNVVAGGTTTVNLIFGGSSTVTTPSETPTATPMITPVPTPGGLVTPTVTVTPTTTIIPTPTLLVTPALTPTPTQTPSVRTLTVCPVGCVYYSAQNAINAANNGDTIYLHSGTYNERINITKSITLRGEDKNTTVISEGGLVIGGRDDVILVDADNVVIENVTVTGTTSYYGGGIYLNNSNGVKILNNKIRNNYAGIFVYSSEFTTISDNNILDNEYAGVLLEKSSNNVVNKNYLNNSRYGFIIEYNYGSDNRYYLPINNRIEENHFININWSAIHSYRSRNTNIIKNTILYIGNNTAPWGGKISVYDSQECNIINNTVLNSNGGIRIYNSSNCAISKNIVNYDISMGLDISESYGNTVSENELKYNNHNGIYLGNSHDNIIFGNNIDSNGVMVSSSSRNRIYHNNFYNSSAYDDGTGNYWDNGFQSGGNYWSNYRGGDNNNDGIGDNLYYLLDQNKVDNYPFVRPNGWISLVIVSISTPTPSPAPTPIPSAVGVGVLFIDKTDLIGDVNDSSIDITGVKGYKNGNIYSFEISLRGAANLSHRSYQILIDGNSVDHPDYSISTWSNGGVKIWDHRGYPSPSVLLKNGMAELNGNKITLTGDFSGIDLSNNKFKVRNDLSSPYPPYDAIETDRLKLDTITQISTPTPTPTPSPTTTPSSTEVVSRYAGIDGIVQKSEAVQAVMDYFSGIITRQDAISVVLAYFNG